MGNGCGAWTAALGRRVDVTTDQARPAFGQRTQRTSRIRALAEASATTWRRGSRSNARGGPADSGTTPKCHPRHIFYPHSQTTERRFRMQLRCLQRDRACSAPDVAASLRSRPNRPGSEDPLAAQRRPLAGLGSQETRAKRRPSGKTPRSPRLAPSSCRTSRPVANPTKRRHGSGPGGPLPPRNP